MKTKSGEIEWLFELNSNAQGTSPGYVVANDILVSA